MLAKTFKKRNGFAKGMALTPYQRMLEQYSKQFEITVDLENPSDKSLVDIALMLDNHNKFEEAFMTILGTANLTSEQFDNLLEAKLGYSAKKKLHHSSEDQGMLEFYSQLRYTSKNGN
jgi:hypothetical protein